MVNQSTARRSTDESTTSNERVSDVIIVGTGPGGLTAGIYAGKHGLEASLFEKESIGGELVNRHEIRGYPGFPDGVPGTELRSNLIEALDRYDSQVLLTEVEDIVPGQPHIVRTQSGNYEANAVILATGGGPKPLDVPGADRFHGQGIFHCATCDGPLYRDEVVAVVGGTDHAIVDTLHLAKFATEVIVIDPGPKATADESLRDELSSESNVTVNTETEITAVGGAENVLDSIELRETDTGAEWTEEVSGLYAYAGVQPNTEFLEDTVPLDEDGYVKVDDKLESNVDGIFAVGDIRRHSARNIVSAVGDASVAVRAVADIVTE